MTEPQPGDEVIAWESTQRGKEIIMDALGGSTPSKGLPKNTISVGYTDIKYWITKSHHTVNVEFKVRRGEDTEFGQDFSTAFIFVSPPPYKRKLE